jgi:hypothetical protein
MAADRTLFAYITKFVLITQSYEIEVKNDEYGTTKTILKRYSVLLEFHRHVLFNISPLL